MKRSIFTAAIIVATLLASGAGFAAQTLVVNMDVPADDSQSSLRLKHETLGSTRMESEKSTQQASKSKESVIGQVGIITAPKAAIKRLSSSRSRTLYTCPKDTYIAVVTEKGRWYGILMSDSSTGWIDKNSVNLINYQVMNCSAPGQACGSGNRIVDTALRYLGISYRWGGNSVDGIDCSGFVKAVFASHGIPLPRTAREQAQVGIPVVWTQLQPGDRLYFACKGGAVDHAGIYMGNGYFIHSSVRNRGVAVDPITKPLFVKSLVAARRSI